MTDLELELVSMMKHGETLTKLCHSVHRVPRHTKRFFVSEDEQRLCWVSDKKSPEKSTIPFRNMKVLEGQQTELFRRANIPELEPLSFSLVVAGRKKTLDLIAGDHMIRHTWAKGIAYLIRKNSGEVPHTNTVEIIDEKYFDIQQNRNRGITTYPFKRPLPALPIRAASLRNLYEPSAEGNSSDINNNNANSESKSKVKTGLSRLGLHVNRPKSDPDASAVSAMVTSVSSLASISTTPTLTSPQNQTKKALPLPPPPPPPSSPAAKNELQGALQGLRKVGDRTSSTLARAPNQVSHDESKVLFDFVVVISLKIEDNLMVPFVSYSFPPANAQKKSNQNLIASIPQFCFPDIEGAHLSSANAMESKTYSFVLTDIDGSRRYGYCRRVKPKPATPASAQELPECYCIISLYPCFTLFSELLDIVESRRTQNSKVAVFSFLKSVLAEPFPERGQTLHITTQSMTSNEPEKISLYRPNDTAPTLEYVNFSHLFQLLGVNEVISLFASLLFERRIIFISQNLEYLSTCSSALLSILYPFNWQHVFIPVLPKQLLEFVCSPVPFVVGVLAAHEAYIDSLPKEEVIIANLDTGKITGIPGQSDEKALPAKAADALKASLTKANRDAKKRGLLINQDIINAFQEFFVNTFSNYKSALETGSSNSKTGIWFNVDKFIDSKPKADRKFYQQFKMSQMFERFAAELEESNGKNDLGTFEKACVKH